jgi:carbamoyltransferase
MRILGLSAFYHDSAAALVADGQIVAAAQEERFTRIKHDSGFPREAAAYCLEAAGLKLTDVDYIAFYDKPFLKFERLLETYLAIAPHGFKSFSKALPVWLKEKLFMKRLLIDELEALAGGARKDIARLLLFAEHHQSHAASAFYPSPFEEAIVLTADGVGEWATTSVAIGRGTSLEMVKEIHFPHSLGLLYSAFTSYCGFKVNSGEYKLMGLAPYGEPRYTDVILEHLLDVKPDGSFRLDQRYFDYMGGLRMTNARFDALFGGVPARSPDAPLEQRHMDIAASIQKVTEEVMLKLTRALAQEHGINNLCLAGGVALNCVANGEILRDGSFERLWIQPAAGDAGGSLGAALAAYHGMLGGARTAVPDGGDAMAGSYLGPAFSQEEIERRLVAMGAVFERAEDDEALMERTARALEKGDAIGWFQGRMEFGPRALGGRSILADPRGVDTQRRLNLKIKFRESFRPFAPSILRERVAEWFDLDEDSPYMLLVADVAAQQRTQVSEEEDGLWGIERLNMVRSTIPSVTHVDYSARIQTVDGQWNPRYRALLEAFEARTGCPVLVNTSFNVRGEPIVCTPEDAFRCFMGTEIDLLVIGDCLLRKGDQDQALAADYKERFALD